MASLLLNVCQAADEAADFLEHFSWWESEEFEGATGDGKRIRATARFEFLGPDHFTFKLTDATRNGEASPGADLDFRRKN